MIYFLANADGTHYKIGTTVRLSIRIKQLQIDTGQSLTVVGVMDGSYAEETALHKRFARIRAWGEWFFSDEGLSSFIGENARAWNGEDESPRPMSVKLEPDVIQSARVVAALRGVTITALLSGMLRDDLARMEAEEINKRAKSPKPPKR